MSDEFDPYHRWLGIPPKYQPADFYRLLGVEQFEADAEVISDAAERQIAHVRRKALSQHVALSQKLLNELAAAKGCLLDARRKQEYDARLHGAGAVGSPGPQPIRAVQAQPAPRPIATDNAPLGNDPLGPPVSSATILAVSQEELRLCELASPIYPESSILTPTIQEPAARTLAKQAFSLARRGVRFAGPALAALLSVAALGASGWLIWNHVRSSAEVEINTPTVAGDASSPPSSPPSPTLPDAPQPAPAKNGEPREHPIFGEIKPQAIHEESLFQLGLNAQQEPMHFRLVPPVPAGAKVDSATGFFTWTPTESQGPGSFTFTAEAATNEFASPPVDRVTFQVDVLEVNKPPVFEMLTDKTGVAGKPLTFSLKAIDPDIPSNKLRFEMSGQTSGMWLGDPSGVFSWTPANSSASQTNRITFFVTDDGTPALKGQQTILITVPAVKPAAAAAPVAARRAGDITGTFRQDNFSNTIQMRFKGTDIEVFGALVPSANPNGIYKRTAANTYTYTNGKRRLTITAVGSDVITWREGSGVYTFRRISN